MSFRYGTIIQSAWFLKYSIVHIRTRVRSINRLLSYPCIPEGKSNNYALGNIDKVQVSMLLVSHSQASDTQFNFFNKTRINAVTQIILFFMKENIMLSLKVRVKHLKTLICLSNWKYVFPQCLHPAGVACNCGALTLPGK